jgi:hypothetical protein
VPEANNRSILGIKRITDYLNKRESWEENFYLLGLSIKIKLI